jgi:hypothetical protein
LIFELVWDNALGTWTYGCRWHRCTSSAPTEGRCNPTYRFAQNLPTDPHTLLSAIQQQLKGQAGPYWDFQTIGILLYSAPPPLVTAALYRAAALVPGVTMVPDATDAAGRHGVAVAFSFAGVRTEWIFCKQTLQYLGSRDINIASGETLGQTAILQRAFVDHAGQTPG